MQDLGESLSGVSLASLCPSLWRGTRRVRIVSPRAPFGPLRLQLRLRALTPICRRRRHNGAGAAGGGFLGAQLINLQRPRSLPGPLARHSHEKEENCSYDYKRPRHRGHGREVVLTVFSFELPIDQIFGYAIGCCVCELRVSVR
jgi:hypothetical protein